MDDKTISQKEPDVMDLSPISARNFFFGSGGRLPFAVFVALVCIASTGCEKQASVSPPPPPLVRTAAVARSDSARELRLSGTLEAERSVALSFSVPGTVEQVLVQEGDAVARGQALARITARTYEDALGIAKAKADQAEDAYRRLEPMHRNQTIPDVKFVEIETGLHQARLAVSIAKKNVEDTVLRAPEPGVVARRQLEAGVSAAPGIPVIILVQTKVMLAASSVPEKQLARVHKGDAARVFVAATGKTYEGVVRTVGVMADPLTRTYTVKVAIENPGELSVGMVASTTLKVDEGGGGFVVPPEAVRVDEGGNPFVFVVGPDKKLKLRRVQVLGFAGEGTALSGGVAQGDLVVISGTPMLGDGMVVRTSAPAGEGK